MAKLSAYTTQTDEYYENKYKENLIQLPEFIEKYFNHKESSLAPSTKYNYSKDYVVFFEWAKGYQSEFSDIPMRKLPLDILKSLTGSDLDAFMSYLTMYEHNNQTNRNTYNGKARKLSSISSMYKYFIMQKLLESDPTEAVELKNLSEGNGIIQLQPNEVAKLLDCVECGDGFLEQADSEKNNKIRGTWYKINHIRDLAIITTLLGTGIRVSELVGIDLSDIDFEDGSISITRKGHKAGIVYMNKEVTAALLDYIHNGREHYQPDKKEKALFLSVRHTRITVRAVELLMKKYVAVAIPQRRNEKITPHKMRSTFGSTLYQKTGDIKLVADTLGHKSIATTQKHYAASNESIKRSAFNKVQLRSDT